MSSPKTDRETVKSAMSAISVVIPVYGDRDALERTLHTPTLDGCQVIVAATPGDRASFAAIRSRHLDIVWIECVRGRARQMNAGAAHARGDWILFLHADTQLPRGWQEEVLAAARDPQIAWGCFRFALDSPARIARMIERGVWWRVRLFGLPYGDQAIFVRRDVFDRMGGYADLPLMEDVDLVRRLKGRGRLFRSDLPAVTSARRWERDGWIRRSSGNVLLLTAYFGGVSPERLERLYNRNHADQTGPGHPQL